MTDLSTREAALREADGPEMDRYNARMKAKGLISASKWPRTEAEAIEFNRVEDWLEVPSNKLSSRLRGEIFLLKDGAQQTTNLRTGNVTPPDKAKLRLADFLEEVAVFLEGLSS